MKVTRIKGFALSLSLLLLVGTGLVTSASSIPVPDNSFEVSLGGLGGTIFGPGYTYNPTGTGVDWSFQGDSGITQNNTAWGFSNAPDGTQVAFLQEVSDASQTISGFTSGDEYTLSFYLEQRPRLWGEPGDRQYRQYHI
jgi:hypothetical protein